MPTAMPPRAFNPYVSIPAIHALMECPICKQGRGQSRLDFPVETTVCFGTQGWGSVNGPQLRLDVTGDPIIMCNDCGVEMPLWAYLTDKKDLSSIEIENLIECAVTSIREASLELPDTLKVDKGDE